MTNLILLDAREFHGPLPPAEEVLSAGELRTFCGLEREARRRQFLLGRLLLKASLLRYRLSEAADLSSIDTTRRPSGQPQVDGAEFSLSHSEGVFLLALGKDAPIGADIERVQAFDVGMLERCFSPKERRAIAESDTREETATLLWCAKEAIVKAAGTGFRTDPSEIPVSWSAEQGFADPHLSGGAIRVRGLSFAHAVLSSDEVATAAPMRIDELVDLASLSRG